MISVWISVAFFFVVYLTKIASLWIILTAWTTSLAVTLLTKNKLPSTKYIIISICFALIASFSYFAYSRGFLVQMVFTGITCLLSSLAIFSVMEKHGGFQLIKTDKKYSPLISVLIGLGTGAILGLINLLLGKNSMDVDFAITLPRIIVSLIPGINEEISNRAIFMAFLIYIFTTENKAPTKFQSFTMWVLMTVPHCFAHGYSFFESLILLVLFGIPFAILQRKRDLTSAIISHTVVDLMRFLVFGLPV